MKCLAHLAICLSVSRLLIWSRRAMSDLAAVGDRSSSSPSGSRSLDSLTARDCALQLAVNTRECHRSCWTEPQHEPGHV